MLVLNLESNRDEYYSGLNGISQDCDWNGWIAFFLQAITVQARANSARVREIMDLYEAMKLELHEVTRSQYSVYLLDAIFNKPIFKVTDVCKQLNLDYGIHEKTVADLLKQLRNAGILKTIQSASGRRSATVCFPSLLNVAEGKRVM